jgi:hypothetical protein
MVDEFQDVNGLQVKFLDLLLNLTINYFVLEMIGKVFMVLEVQMWITLSILKCIIKIVRYIN